MAEYPNGLQRNKNGTLRMPQDFHGPDDLAVSFRMKNGFGLSEDELDHLWNHLIFRVAQIESVIDTQGSLETIDDYHHLMAIGITCVYYYHSSKDSQKRSFVEKVMYYIDGLLFDCNIPGFSSLLYCTNQKTANSLFMKFLNAFNKIFIKDQGQN